ncbi:patatin-like phospholipase family protein [Sphingobium sp. AN558]|uniref:patatin-like phospholipase family protein n=1 Tax=Sphingobium sp. AN558 TaxID=3133442 RepID=UPI0030C23FF6
MNKPQQGQKPASTSASVILGGGVGLGAFEAGALEHLLARPDIAIRSISGASIGAINGAIVAGNAPADRVPQLRAFWDAVSVETFPSAWIDPFGLAASGPVRNARNWANACTTALIGVPSLFSLRSILSGRGKGKSIYDNSLATRTLDRWIDFDRLNRGDIRFCAATTDIERGEAVFFDTAKGDRIGVEHILASASLLTAFEPVRIGDRLLADGGLCCNVPFEAEIGPARDGAPEPLCLAIDLFTPGGPAPTALNRVVERSLDLMFGMQTRMRLAALEREWEWRSRISGGAVVGEAGAGVDLLYLHYRAGREEAGFAKPFDFSPDTLADRWRTGRRSAEDALTLLPSLGQSGLRVHRHESVGRTTL